MFNRKKTLLLQVGSYALYDIILSLLYMQIHALFSEYTFILSLFFGTVKFTACSVINFAFHRRLTARAVRLAIVTAVAMIFIMQLPYFLPVIESQIFYLAVDALTFMAFYFIMAKLYCVVDKDASFKDSINKKSMLVVIGLLTVYILSRLAENRMADLLLSKGEAMTFSDYSQLMNIGTLSNLINTISQYAMMIVLSAHLPFHRLQEKPLKTEEIPIVEGQLRMEEVFNTENSSNDDDEAEEKWKFNWRRY